MFASNARHWWAPQIRAGDVVRWPYSDAETAPIDERDIGAMAARALLDARHVGGDYVLTGPESLSQAAQVRAIGDAIGRPLRLEELSPDEFRRETAATWHVGPMTMASERKSSMERQELSLNEAATHVLEECRTVVPGMQALFGFQLIAVFSATFEQQLSSAERVVHLAAIGLVTIAIVLVMAPAALHRQTEPMAISQRLTPTRGRIVAQRDEQHRVHAVIVNRQTSSEANSHAILDSLATALRSFGMSERECEPGSSPAGAIRSWLYEDRKVILVHISEITPQTGPPRLMGLAVDSVDAFPRGLCH